MCCVVVEGRLHVMISQLAPQLYSVLHKKAVSFVATSRPDTPIQDLIRLVWLV